MPANETPNHRSLRSRLLLPLVGAALLASVFVAATSSSMGQRRAMDQIRVRFESIEATLGRSTFPLTDSVLRSLSELTGAEWITLGRDGRVRATTLPRENVRPIAADELARLPRENRKSEDRETNPIEIAIGDQRYYAFAFGRRGASVDTDGVASTVILFDRESVDAAAFQSALFPIVAGLSTIGLISILMAVISSRLVTRIRRVEDQVEQIARGDFTARVGDAGDDEIGRLSSTVNSMAGQLDNLWNQVNRQQGAKLLHQIAGGMAHQLRNTLTGARMAMELHQSNCADSSDEDVRVAIRQLQVAADYVDRLLTVGSTAARNDQPGCVFDCLDDVRSTHESIARHLRARLEWTIAADLRDYSVKDAPTFSAALSNLVLNAMESGDHVWVKAHIRDDHECEVTVTDNGPGIDDEIAADLFEPFVTSKPEGVGLGLPLVKRTAIDLGGDVGWHRSDGLTTFRLVCRCDREPIPCPA